MATDADVPDSAEPVRVEPIPGILFDWQIEEFESGVVEMDEPPGFSERAYQAWRKAGGRPIPEEVSARRTRVMNEPGGGGPEPEPAEDAERELALTDPELTAMGAVVVALKPLAGETRVRILRWAMDRFAEPIASQVIRKAFGTADPREGSS